MITPRTTRLIRVADLGAFRTALAGPGLPGSRAGRPRPPDPRPYPRRRRAAAPQPRRPTLAAAGTLVLPDLLPVGELVTALPAAAVGCAARALGGRTRGPAGCRLPHGESAGFEPPFRLRPGLVTEMLRFYDTLRLNQKNVDVFERLALGMLEPGAADDRGAERLVRQTRFLAAAFRDFEERCAARPASISTASYERLLETAAPMPYRHVVVAVGDRAFDPNWARAGSLGPADPGARPRTARRRRHRPRGRRGVPRGHPQSPARHRGGAARQRAAHRAQRCACPRAARS